MCVNNENGGQNCVNDISDAQFKQLEQNPGSGVTFQNGVISVTVNGQTTDIGTYSFFVGPKSQGGQIEDATVDLLGFVGLAEGAVRGFMALGDAAVSGIGRLFGVGAEKAVPALAGGGAKATVDDILQGATIEDQGGGLTITSKPGGIVRAESDFKSLAGREEIRGPVRIKELPDGRRAVLRTDPSTWSRDGRPTLEIQPPGGGRAKIKIRY